MGFADWAITVPCRPKRLTETLSGRRALPSPKMVSRPHRGRHG